MRKLLYCVIGAMLIAVNANAMDLSLQDAVDKIVAESNDVKKADANVKKAKAQLSSVNANRWFSIDANLTYMNLIDPKNPTSGQGIAIPSEVGAMLAAVTHGQMTQIPPIPDNMFGAGVQITQPIYTFGKIGNAVDAVHDAIDMSASAKDLTLREVKYAAANFPDALVTGWESVY